MTTLTRLVAEGLRVKEDGEIVINGRGERVS